MRVVCVYRQDTDLTREIEEWIGDFERRTSKEIEIVDPDSVAGGGFAEAYDIVEYPTLVAISDDGKVLDEWRGVPLPRMDEVSYYAAEKLKI